MVIIITVYLSFWWLCKYFLLDFFSFFLWIYHIDDFAINFYCFNLYLSYCWLIFIMLFTMQLFSFIFDSELIMLLTVQIFSIVVIVIACDLCMEIFNVYFTHAFCSCISWFTVLQDFFPVTIPVWCVKFYMILSQVFLRRWKWPN